MSETDLLKLYERKKAEEDLLAKERTLKGRGDASVSLEKPAESTVGGVSIEKSPKGVEGGVAIDLRRCWRAADVKSNKRLG